MPFLNLLIYIVAFILIWIGSGWIVTPMARFSKRLRLSSFAVSFIVLGLLTSLPELSVGLQSVSNHEPEIFVGNLLGGIPAIFLFIIPILAIFGNGINVRHDIDKKTLLVSLGVIIAPSLLVLNQKVSRPEGIILILLYFMLLLLIQKRQGIFDRSKTQLLTAKAYSSIDVLKIVAGIIIVFLTSSIIVNETIYFATIFQVSPFYISLIAISLGTNLPELSLAVRSVVTGNKDIALGDYLGSAAANTLLFGAFTLLSGGEVVTVNNFFVTFIFIAFGLTLFYCFARFGNNITRREGICLLILYFVFVTYELLRR